MNLKDYPFKTSFTHVVKACAPGDMDAYLSEASLKSLKGIIPVDVDFGRNIDLIPNAFNACVVNRANKNHDGITTDVALRIYKDFIHKPCNIEHNRSQVVGAINNAGFSSFGDNEVLQEEGVKESKDPFNIALSALVYRVVNEKFTNLLVESSDESSPYYMFVCASWELAFTDYHILVGDKNIAEGELVTDPKLIKELSQYLRATKGSGEMPDGTPVYRFITGNVLPLGVAYTSNPAADVKGVFTDLINEEPKTKISQSTSINVRTGEQHIMSIESLEQLKKEWEVIRQQESSASVTSFIKEELVKQSKDASEKLKAKDEEVKQVKAEARETAKQVSELQAQLEKVTKEYEELVLAARKREAEVSLKERMSALDNEFDLTQEDREIIANKISGLDDEAYAEWKAEFDVLSREKNKEYKTRNLEKIKESLASKNKEVIAQGIDSAINEVTANADHTLVANSQTQTVSNRERLRSLLSRENIQIITQ